MPISCEDCRDRLSEILEEDHPASPEIAAHLATCADCTRDLAMLRQMRAELRTLPMMSAPPDLRARVQAELKQSLPQSTAAAAEPFSIRPGLMTALLGFFSRPANVAWTSGLALAAFCLLLVARPQQSPPVNLPTSSPAAQQERMAKDSNGSDSRANTAKARAPRTAASPTGAPEHRPVQRNTSTLAVERSAKYLSPRTMPEPSPPQAAPFTDTAPGIAPENSGTRRTAASKKAEFTDRVLSIRPSYPTTELRSGPQWGRIARAERIHNGNRISAPDTASLSVGGPLPQQTPNNQISTSAVSESLRLNSALHEQSRPLLARLDWVTVDERREAGSKFNDDADEAKSKKDQTLSEPGGRGGGSGGMRTDFSVGATFGSREPAAKPESSVPRNERLAAASKAAPATTAPAAPPADAATNGVRGYPAGAAGSFDGAPAGPQGPQGPALPPGVTILADAPKPAEKNLLDIDKAKATPAPDAKRDRGRLTVTPSILWRAGTANYITTLHVGEGRKARLTIVPSRNLLRGLVQVNPSGGLRLEENAAGEQRTVWFGSTQAGHAITVPLTITATLPGSQTLQISLRDMGSAAKSVANESETLVVSVLPR